MLNTTPWFETVLFCDQLPLLLSNLGNEMIYSMMNEVQVRCISAAVRRLLDLGLSVVKTIINIFYKARLHSILNY